VKAVIQYALFARARCNRSLLRWWQQPTTVGRFITVFTEARLALLSNGIVIIIIIIIYTTTVFSIASWVTSFFFLFLHKTSPLCFNYTHTYTHTHTHTHIYIYIYIYIYKEKRKIQNHSPSTTLCVNQLHISAIDSHHQAEQREL